MPLTSIDPQRLLSRIQLAISQNPQLTELLQDITKYIEESRETLSLQPNGTQPASKKRKLDNVENDTLEGVDSIDDISFSIPQRKKLKLSLGGKSIRGINPSSDATEFGRPWAGVAHCVCLPVPEKAQPQYNVCIFPSEGWGDEQILFTVPGGNVKSSAIHSQVSFDNDESYKDVMIRMINKRLKRKVLEPDQKEFVSQVVQAHRKGEKAAHVKAFRGSKDGMSSILPPIHFALWPLWVTGMQKPPSRSID